MKSFFIIILGIFSAIYLLNPTAGIFELLPDVLPVVGNLDEAGAMALLISSLAYFGIDFGNFFKRKEVKDDFAKQKDIKDAEIVEDE